jgi:hypothetical protein
VKDIDHLADEAADTLTNFEIGLFAPVAAPQTVSMYPISGLFLAFQSQIRHQI